MIDERLTVYIPSGSRSCLCHLIQVQGARAHSIDPSPKGAVYVHSIEVG